MFIIIQRKTSAKSRRVYLNEVQFMNWTALRTTRVSESSTPQSLQAVYTNQDSLLGIGHNLL
jgi:hypothetical protein